MHQLYCCTACLQRGLWLPKRVCTLVGIMGNGLDVLDAALPASPSLPALHLLAVSLLCSCIALWPGCVYLVSRSLNSL
ncbi:hypothetical protein V8C86DRAFT_2589277, partial [Haematococcus lacustris]